MLPNSPAPGSTTWVGRFYPILLIARTLSLPAIICSGLSTTTLEDNSSISTAHSKPSWQTSSHRNPRCSTSVASVSYPWNGQTWYIIMMISTNENVVWKSINFCIWKSEKTLLPTQYKDTPVFQNGFGGFLHCFTVHLCLAFCFQYSTTNLDATWFTTFCSWKDENYST